MVRKLAVLLLLLVPYSVASANKRFEAPIGDVFSAAIETVQARGLVLSANKEAGRITFISGWFQGTIVLTGAGRSTDVVIETKTVNLQERPTSPDMAWGFHDATAKGYLESIGKVLQGKPPKPNHRLQRVSREVAAKLAPSNPATELIRGTKEDVQSALMAECATQGLAIISQTDRQITVAKEAANLKEMSELLIGNYSVHGYRFTVQFTLAPEGDGIRVTPVAEVLSRNGNGATVATIVTEEPEARAFLQAILNAAKQRVESKKAL